MNSLPRRSLQWHSCCFPVCESSWDDTAGSAVDWIETAPNSNWMFETHLQILLPSALLRGDSKEPTRKKRNFLELLFEKQQYFISMQTEGHRPSHLKQWFSDPFRDRVWKPPNAKPLDLFPIGFTSISAQKVQNPPRRSSRVLHRFR